MATTTKGTAHLFGIGEAIGSATVQSVSLTKGPALDEETLNLTGVRIEHRLDDVRESGTITLRPQSGYSVPTIGSTLNYDSKNFYIMEVVRDFTNNGFREITLSIVDGGDGITV